MSKFLFPLGCTLFQHHLHLDMEHFLTLHGRQQYVPCWCLKRRPVLPFINLHCLVPTLPVKCLHSPPHSPWFRVHPGSGSTLILRLP